LINREAGCGEYNIGQAKECLTEHGFTDIWVFLNTVYYLFSSCISIKSSICLRM
jgi:hypothetical protein